LIITQKELNQLWTCTVYPLELLTCSKVRGAFINRFLLRWKVWWRHTHERFNIYAFKEMPWTICKWVHIQYLSMGNFPRRSKLVYCVLTLLPHAPTA